MKILSIETSCDETAISILEATGNFDGAEFLVLGNALNSQIEKHAEFGGVHPSLARREHAENILPLLEEALIGAKLYFPKPRVIPDEEKAQLINILVKEVTLRQKMIEFLEHSAIPDIDAIAVTHGPGLEPALWVGFNVARALAYAWNKPLVPVNHMEGHVISSIMKHQEHTHLYTLSKIEFPLVALLISGGHTELVLAHSWMEYTAIGTTRDDAVGEAFDKVARLLGLPYPGGVGLQNLAEQGRAAAHSGSGYHHPMSIDCTLPRPMLHSESCDFSFSGLKTAVLYMIEDIEKLDLPTKQKIAKEFEDSVTEILTTKTRRALDMNAARTLVIGGGVAANTTIRAAFEKMIKADYPNVGLHMPPPELTTDNGIMIAAAGYFRHLKNEMTGEKGPSPLDDLLRVQGNLKLNAVVAPH